MKTIRELRTQLRFNYHEMNSMLGYMYEHLNIDFDVYLKTKRCNLQRGKVWGAYQKRELIWSILQNRKIPRLSIMVENDRYLVIDGKQRLSAMFDFYSGKFPINIDGHRYMYGDLPSDYKAVIRGYAVPYYVAHEDYDVSFSDKDKIDWFKLVNFTGTPQDAAHLARLGHNPS